MGMGISPLEQSVLTRFWRALSPYEVFRTLDPTRLPHIDIVFETSEPLAHIRRDFEIVGMRLTDYVRMTP